MFILVSKSKYFGFQTKYLIIFATHLFFVVPFVYAWMLAGNEQSHKQNKQTQDMQYMSNSCKTRVRSKNMNFKTDNNQQVTQMKAHIMYWFIVKIKSKLFIKCPFFQLIFDLVIKMGSKWYEFGSKTQNVEKWPLSKFRELFKNVRILKRSFNLWPRESFCQNRPVFTNQIIDP